MVVQRRTMLLSSFSGSPELYMKRILIADDYQVVRHGIRQVLLSELTDIEIGEAANATEIIKQLRAGAWDLLMLDINMPGKNGLEVLRQLRDEKCNIPVLVLSMHEEEQMAVRAIRSGATGYLSKAAPADNIITAVRQILDGHKYISPKVAELLAMQVNQKEADEFPHLALGERQMEVFLMIAKGLSLGEMANQLNVSKSTVSNIRSRVLEKMKVENNADLVTYWTFRTY